MSQKTQRVIRAAAERHGAKGCTIESRTRHYLVRLTRADGSTVSDTFARVRADPFKIQGWIRQLIRNGNTTYQERA